MRISEHYRILIIHVNIQTLLDTLFGFKENRR